MSDDPLGLPPRPGRGQPLFAAGLLVFAGFLLAQYPRQTTWAEETQLFAQPGFWPAVSVGGMTLFAALHFWQLPRRRLTRPDWREGRNWLAVLEFGAWFLAFVFLVPVAGYLVASVLFLPALVRRLGYRDPALIWTAAGAAAVIVVVFKGFLDVRIPGGALYDYLPGALRSFFILNL